MKPTTKSFLMGAAVGYWFRGRRDRKKAEAAAEAAEPGSEPGLLAYGITVVFGPFLVGIVGALAFGLFVLVWNLIPGGSHIGMGPEATLRWGYWVTVALMCLALYVAIWAIGDMEQIGPPVRLGLIAGLVIVHGLVLWKIIDIGREEGSDKEKAPSVASSAADAGTLPPGRVALTVGIAVDSKKPDGRAWDVGDGKPDIEGTIKLSGQTLSIPLCSDTLECDAQFPSATIASGAEIEIELTDRDIAANDSIGSGSMKWSGQPQLRKRIGAATVTLDFTSLEEMAPSGSGGGVAERDSVTVDLEITAQLKKTSGDMWDPEGGEGLGFWPDITATLTVDAIPRTKTCPDDSPTCELSFPGVLLDRAGTTITLEFVDRDGAASEEIGSGTLTWAGEPDLAGEFGQALVLAHFKVAGSTEEGPSSVVDGGVAPAEAAAGASGCDAEPRRVQLRIVVDRTTENGSGWDEFDEGDRPPPDPEGLFRIADQPQRFIRTCRNSFTCQVEFQDVRLCPDATIEIFLTDMDPDSELDLIGNATWTWNGEDTQTGRVGSAEVTMRVLAPAQRATKARSRRQGGQGSQPPEEADAS